MTFMPATMAQNIRRRRSTPQVWLSHLRGETAHHAGTGKRMTVQTLDARHEAHMHRPPHLDRLALEFEA